MCRIAAQDLDTCDPINFQGPTRPRERLCPLCCNHRVVTIKRGFGGVPLKQRWHCLTCISWCFIMLCELCYFASWQLMPLFVENLLFFSFYLFIIYYFFLFILSSPISLSGESFKCLWSNPTFHFLLQGWLGFALAVSGCPLLAEQILCRRRPVLRRQRSKVSL